MKLWAGRFQKELDPSVNDFNSSISFDGRMVFEDIEGSIAHATMLGACGIITEEESRTIKTALQGIAADLKNGTLQLDPNAEDVHTNIESVLTERIGAVGKKLHTARSRNDQVALDIRLYLRGKIGELDASVKTLLQTLITLAEKHTDTIMPGYTHLQRAQPITFAHHLLAYAEMLTRDRGRLKDCNTRMDALPLGSAALAGTTYPIDRKMTAQLLGFSDITHNSLDAVSDRDFCVELASALSILMMHLSRFSEEVILWCSSEFKFVTLDDAYSTGSSIMPQKKNPDIPELVRGKSGRVFGGLMTLLTMLKGLPLAYNKDMQEDKEAIFDAVDTSLLCLSAFNGLMSTITVNKDNMKKASLSGFLSATDCADYLVKKGLPFRDAYKIVGQLVALCLELDTDLEHLPLAEYKKISGVFDTDVYEEIALEKIVKDRKVDGGPAPEAVKKEIERLGKSL